VQRFYFLASRGAAPEAFGILFGSELWLTPANRANRASVQIWADWCDFAPLVGGLPEMARAAFQQRAAGGMIELRPFWPDDED
jgi:hypothetical protein